MRACLHTLIIAVLAVGCTTDHTDAIDTESQGIAEVHVAAGPLLAANITRLTVEAAGLTQELVLNPFTGTFDGTLFLLAGPQTLVARAFSGGTLVGQSQPVPVTVQPGVVVRVICRILDLTTNPPAAFGPIFDSIVFPTTTQVGAAPTFAIAVIAPSGDPVTYTWTSDCVDATFSAPSAATTTWSKAAPGACNVVVTAASNGFAIQQSFVIVVFPAGTGSGAVTAEGVLVTAPAVLLSMGRVGCAVASTSATFSNGSCPVPIASPATTSFNVSPFTWGAASTPGTIELSDDCGGRFGTSSHGPGGTSGTWLPPVQAGLCKITARAVNGDGLVETVTAAVLVRAGTPATSQPPSVFAFLDNACLFGSESPARTCFPVPAGSQRFVSGSIGWGNDSPGSVVVSDDCAGVQIEPEDAFSFFVPYLVAGQADQTCTAHVHATSLQGGTSDVSVQYQISR